jgi:hypothetical protein
VSSTTTIQPGPRAVSLSPSAEPALGGESLPTEVEMILSAMEAAAPSPGAERRALPRWPYRTRADLHLFSDAPGTPPWLLYTRDASPRGLGFITPHQLSLGHGGWVEIPDHDGQRRAIHCTLFRCREAVQGWYEGALHFHREQWWFAPPSAGDKPGRADRPFMRLVK